MNKTAQKCENDAAIFMQKYTLKLFFALKIAHFSCVILEGNLNFQDFFQRQFCTGNSPLNLN